MNSCLYIGRLKVRSNNRSHVTLFMDIQKVVYFKTSFILIMEPRDVELFKIFFMREERDYDILDETLGEFIQKLDYTLRPLIT